MKMANFPKVEVWVYSAMTPKIQTSQLIFSGFTSSMCDLKLRTAHLAGLTLSPRIILSYSTTWEILSIVCYPLLKTTLTGIDSS